MKCFVIAMEKEAAPVISAMEKTADKSVCGKRVVHGYCYGQEIAVIVCGVGKVNAACGAQLAVDLFKPERIINIGVAGGLNGGVNVGNIYSVRAAVQYDFDLTQLNGTKIGTLDECRENYLPLSSTDIFPFKLLATGDRFNDSKKDFELLTKTLTADIRDMEGAAVAQVCMHAGVLCAEYKIISDLAGSGSTTEQYLKNLNVCFEAMKNELERIVLNG